MRLVRIPDDSSIEEQILGILNVREGMTASTSTSLSGARELAQGEIRGDARRLSVKIGERSFDTPFNFTATGITLQSPIVVEGKSYSTFTWDGEAQQFTSGDLVAKLFLPKSYKPIDFWYGTWTLRHNPVRGWRKLPPSPSQLVSEPIPSRLSSPSTESATRWCFPTMLPRYDQLPGTGSARPDE